VDYTPSRLRARHGNWRSSNLRSSPTRCHRCSAGVSVIAVGNCPLLGALDALLCGLIADVTISAKRPVVVAKTIPRRRPGPCDILAFRSGKQAIRLARLLGEPHDEGLGIVPIHADDGIPLVLGKARIAERSVCSLLNSAILERHAHVSVVRLLHKGRERRWGTRQR